jgi:hypothetical protein
VQAGFLSPVAGSRSAEAKTIIGGDAGGSGVDKRTESTHYRLVRHRKDVPGQHEETRNRAYYRC